MCGRFTNMMTWAEIHALYSINDDPSTRKNTPARYNIAPTQDVFYCIQKDGERAIEEGQWWLVPHWAKANDKKYPTFNARSEDAHKKPSFRDAYKWGRCLIPADGYYEWTKNKEDGKKDPHHIHLTELEHFSFAGLSTYHTALDIHSCTILTAAAVPEIAHLHHRMPIILKSSTYEKWLDAATPVEDAVAQLSEHRDAELISHRVGREVGNSRAKGEQLIAPV